MLTMYVLCTDKEGPANKEQGSTAGDELESDSECMNTTLAKYTLILLRSAWVLGAQQL